MGVSTHTVEPAVVQAIGNLHTVARVKSGHRQQSKANESIFMRIEGCNAIQTRQAATLRPHALAASRIVEVVQSLDQLGMELIRLQNFSRRI